MTQSYFERFKDIALQVTSGKGGEAGFWRLQVAGRDAILDVDASSPDALKQICEIFRLLLGGASGSLIVGRGERWKVMAASGDRAERILGMTIDMEKSSVTSSVIRTKTPFFLSTIDEVEGVSKTNNPDRYSSDAFCSFPLLGRGDAILGVINAAGMDSSHPMFKTEPGSMKGVMAAISLKIAENASDEELDTAKRDLENLRQTDTVKEKLYHMAVHDLKNPLTLISSNLAYLENLELSEAALEIVELSRFGSERMLDMVKTILDSHKIQSGRMELDISLFDLATLAGEAKKDFRLAASTDGIDLALSAPDKLMVEADMPIVRRIFSNLIDNALKHSPYGGEVKLAVEAKGSMAQFSVQNEGEGLPPENRQNVFNLFERLKSADGGGYEGYGLGLAFCKMAAHAHKGEIMVESEPGKGAKFIVTIPLRVGS